MLHCAHSPASLAWHPSPTLVPTLAPHLQGAKALSNLADHCGAQLMPCMDRLVSLYHSVLHAGACSTPGTVQQAMRAVHEEDVHMVRGGTGGGWGGDEGRDWGRWSGGEGGLD